MLYLLFIALSSMTMGCSSHSSIKQNQEPVKNNLEIVGFVYHRFGDSRYPTTNISTKDFEAHLKYLKENEVQVMTLSDAMSRLNSSNNQMSNKIVVLTIDDGYSSFYENGLKILRKYDFPATLFINTESVGAPGYMNWQELSELKKAGIEIGNHTHTHSYFLNKDENKRYDLFRSELQKCQELIENNLGEKPTVFAYPFGEYDMKMRNIVKEMNFRAAFAQNSGVIDARTDQFLLPRFPMSEYFAAIDKFKEKVKMNSLTVQSKEPDSPILDEDEPQLTFSIDKSNLSMDQIQCFIQGAECDISKEIKENQVKIILKAKSSIKNRRRTLYTVTVPDKDGNWYWYSHLWINPK